ncbi:streptomycin biosynthesis protein StrI [Actinoplanes sp. NBRC 14428]|uniref:Oxidoreductase family protein n=1 Tax=Pseudosporangium ferrugineum TaxID=439699 RepID=A0A2T0SFX4_9ACTN|nr:Gfo/Idh/MocA family oxidoreductase [Pseudosporangium ferrugineum]PRY32309.1 oxidoreductase family protein [Pseudosporangium ferrugineum]BCJ49438.1 streptomycin biosynthesis protein StrI [Actinoplanes sp. NBRC 14428]
MPVTLALAGAGLRGLTYARHAVATGRARVVAIAEPDPHRRESAAAEFGVAPVHAYPGWAELAAAGRLADAAVVATQDRMHRDPAVRLADLGYHLLLEKPMAPTEEEASAIAAAATRNGVILAVCHVLRYTAYTRMVKGLLDDGRIGRLVSFDHLEPVGWWHQAHSFVRGNWRHAGTSGPMLLTKSCHDLDWLVYVTGQLPSRISSFGSLTHFRASERPEGAAGRCLDCAVEPACPYSAKRRYFAALADPDEHFWPLGAITSEYTAEALTEALRTGPYGRCVYACDNDVVDHQVVAMEFPGGATGSFTMSAFTPMEQRRTRLMGTHGYLEGDGRTVRHVDFVTGEDRRHDSAVAGGPSAADGHGGGDEALTGAFLDAVAAGDPALITSGAAQSLATHRVVWAAERAREGGEVVHLRPDGTVVTPAGR